MVTGVVVVICLIQVQGRIGRHYIACDGQHFYAILILDGVEHVSGRTPVFVQQVFVVEVHYQFAHGFGTDVNAVLWVI